MIKNIMAPKEIVCSNCGKKIKDTLQKKPLICPKCKNIILKPTY